MKQWCSTFIFFTFKMEFERFFVLQIGTSGSVKKFRQWQKISVDRFSKIHVDFLDLSTAYLGEPTAERTLMLEWNFYLHPPLFDRKFI